MANNLVSVCIPCHNAIEYISQAIDSLLAQTWINLEVIVVDDCSTDGSTELLRRYSHPKLHVIHHNLGSAARSRNKALAAAQGEWIKFFDADDLLHPEAIENQLERLENREDAVASSAWGRFYDDDISTFKLNPQSVWRDMAGVEWLVEAWRDAQPMTQPGMFLIPRALIDQVGAWDESLTLTDDFEFFARLFCNASDVLFTQEATLYYRSGLPSSLSGQKSREAYESAVHSLLKGTDHLLQRRSDPDACLSCANVLQQFIYEVYPAHADLRLLVQEKIHSLGGSDLAPPGGPWYQRASRLIGWKAAKRLQRAAGRA